VGIQKDSAGTNFNKALPSGPIWPVSGEFLRRSSLLANEAGFNGGGDQLRCDHAFGWGQAKPVADAGVGHFLIHHAFEATVLVAGSDPVISLHVFEFLVCKHQDGGSILSHSEIGSGELVYFGGIDDFVDATAFFFTHTDPTHHSRQTFIARAVFVWVRSCKEVVTRLVPRLVGSFV